MRSLLVVILLLVFQGCEEKREIFARFLTTDRFEVTCVDINRSSADSVALKSTLDAEGFATESECDFRVDLLKSYAACSAKEFPGASRGVIRLELSGSGKNLYQVQQEFDDGQEDAVIRRLAARMKEDLTTVLP